MISVVNELILLDENGEGVIRFAPAKKNPFSSSHPITIIDGKLKASGILSFNYDSDNDGIIDSTIIKVSYIAENIYDKTIGDSVKENTPPIINVKPKGRPRKIKKSKGVK